MKPETIEYLRGREEAERAAVGNATCEAARRAHEEMANAYARRVQIEEVKSAGALPSGRVITLAEAQRERDAVVRGRPRAPLAKSGASVVQRF